MKFYLQIPQSLEKFYLLELSAYRQAMDKGHLQQAWKHLERAHIIGQKYPLAHTRVHLKMIGFGIRIKSVKEVLGQIPRLFFGGVKSFVGKVPLGNPGGANVPPLKSFPIAEDIQQIFVRTGVEIK